MQHEVNNILKVKSPGGGTQEKVLTVRKEKSRDAARSRRSKENLQFTELARLLPLPENITSQLDKASVIRLTISFLKYRDLTGKEIHQSSKQILNGGVNVNGQELSLNAVEKDLGLHMLQALDGFLFCISQEGRFLYVSETVSTHLGLSQLDLIGSSVFNVIHADDHKEFSELLCKPVQPNVQNSFMGFKDFDAMTTAEMYRKSQQGYISIFVRMKCTLVKRGNCFVKSSGYKVIKINGQMVPFKSTDHKGEQPFALIATGQPLPPPTICELKLDTKVFVSRVGMDLKIAFCEGKIRKYMDYRAKDIVGMSAYEFYHLNDMVVVQDAHTDCLQTGKCVSRCYRWMNKVGGWVWMQTVGSVIKRTTPRGEESQILCVNYIFSEVEQRDEIMHSIQQHFKALEIHDKPRDKRITEFDDYEIEEKVAITNANTSKDFAPLDANNDAMDKDSYLLALQYNNQISTNAQMEMTSSCPVPVSSLDALIDPYGGLAIPSITDNIPTWQESQDLENANEIANNMLIMEMDADTTQPKYPFPYENQSSPEDSNLIDPVSMFATERNQYCDQVCSMKSTSTPIFYNNVEMQQISDVNNTRPDNQFSSNFQEILPDIVTTQLRSQPYPDISYNSINIKTEKPAPFYPYYNNTNVPNNTPSSSYTECFDYNNHENGVIETNKIARNNNGHDITHEFLSQHMQQQQPWLQNSLNNTKFCYPYPPVNTPQNCNPETL